MGDRTWWDEECPKCGAIIEVYDAPSSLQWCKICEKCGYDDGQDYYEIGKYEVVLCTKKELNRMCKSRPEVMKFRKKIDSFWNDLEKNEKRNTKTKENSKSSPTQKRL